MRCSTPRQQESVNNYFHKLHKLTYTHLLLLAFSCKRIRERVFRFKNSDKIRSDRSLTSSSSISTQVPISTVSQGADFIGCELVLIKGVVGSVKGRKKAGRERKSKIGSVY
ncbi:hypothetical protein K2173_021957 [Erythroxylum novogranatense]|uniref:Uncharacterized protein n=1 Tax=Erythroxylum novogranatense TaxID=1862640 RepID=A0AAV8T461_9ROSI|nr:hypothetical protein K2173_021957 [Erythroxylum novogranatense]